MNFTEEHIEEYILHPERLSADKKKEIEKSLQENEDLKKFSEWFSEFYRIYDKLIRENEEKSNSIDDQPSFIELMPMKHTQNRERRLFVLAAQTSKVNQHGIESVKTFVSDEHGTLMRVLNDKNRKLTRIHVLSDKIGEKDIIILNIPENNVHLVSKPGGKIAMPSADLKKAEVENWSSCRIILPIITSKIKPSTLSQDGFIAAKSVRGTASVEILAEEDTITLIPFSKNEEHKPLRLVIHSDSGSTLWDLKNGKAEVPKNVFNEVESKLFFYN